MHFLIKDGHRSRDSSATDFSILIDNLWCTRVHLEGSGGVSRLLHIKSKNETASTGKSWNYLVSVLLGVIGMFILWIFLVGFVVDRNTIRFHLKATSLNVALYGEMRVRTCFNRLSKLNLAESYSLSKRTCFSLAPNRNDKDVCLFTVSVRAWGI